ncbi:hypothetical protein H6G51_02935 [Limnothrix sp. FACHB-708]|uniref:hypothetical protein n=1 Tax=unclassified Limnothrix TaxID=2632864 RepID=UPI0016892308|nr:MULTISPECIES: hypothetical protein [unclassified Limnothrix]MBD2552226.1 hypothetical protein [Limnothrix sp. FACHB-708]MBD2592114.1 hypothetical protein [Limnothrix sp. FACHB-406]
MIEVLRQWWSDRQLAAALQRRDFRQVRLLIAQRQQRGSVQSPLAQLCVDFLQQEQDLRETRSQLKTLQQAQRAAAQTSPYCEPNPDCCQDLKQQLKLRAIDQGLWQTTGLPEAVFHPLEIILTKHLEQRLPSRKTSAQKQALRDALGDLRLLKGGASPTYCFQYSAEAYLLEYFLENTLCLFISWLLIYERRQLPRQPRILDLAAGPGTTLFGLLLLRELLDPEVRSPDQVLNYCSVDCQSAFQDIGHQLLRQWSLAMGMSDQSYIQFKTLNLQEDSRSQLPQKFFDWITIAHCFPWDSVERAIFLQQYQRIISHGLSDAGYVLFVIQDKKFRSFQGLNNRSLTDTQEKAAVITFLRMLNLDLEWYCYLNSTGQRSPLGKQEFKQFAIKNLPPQSRISRLRRDYAGATFDLNYGLDDYVIVARPVRNR